MSRLKPCESLMARNSQAGVLVHLYFDDFSRERWIGARVMESMVAALTFDAIAADSWSDELNQHVR